ncbi:MAG TPA: VWA domain-containing protein [Bryobacteraceae bacterium]|nr:VWA domain-containing protein [Bryobacteraceae bacterium]
MQRFVLRWFYISISTALLTAGTAFTGKTEQAPFVIRDNVNLVLLDVSVRKPEGGYVTGLSRNNFTVEDNGVKQQMTQFAAVDAPATVGLIVDNSGSMLRKRQEVVMSGLEFARSSNRNDEFFVVNFNDAVYFGLPGGVDFTDRLQTLQKALHFGSPVGQTALYDAIATGLRHLERGHYDTRTLIVVSDGGDNVSQIDFSELKRLIEASRATIYTIGLLDPDDRDLNPKVLRKISSLSGGGFFAPDKLDDLPAIFEKIAQDLRNRYSIAFIPRNTLNKPNHKPAVHTLKVVARNNQGKKLIVHSRTAYIAAQ